MPEKDGSALSSSGRLDKWDPLALEEKTKLENKFLKEGKTPFEANELALAAMEKKGKPPKATLFSGSTGEITKEKGKKKK